MEAPFKEMFMLIGPAIMGLREILDFTADPESPTYGFQTLQTCSDTTIVYEHVYVRPAGAGIYREKVRCNKISNKQKLPLESRSHLLSGSYTAAWPQLSFGCS